MRLINAKTGELKEFDDDKRPPYAILSHTWGTKDDEINFQEAKRHHKNGDSHPDSLEVTQRSGYKKIQGSRQQALRDGIDWVWVDTCCIDKTSSTELSEAINSMFKWYQQSLVCYVHLSDVMDRSEDFSAKHSAFRHSRWFTRGWTLQELLAPHKVQFYTKDWDRMGEMTEGSKLVDVVSEITSIPPGFLEGENLRLANAAQKMSWAAKRNTSKKEDTAYCLLGIFNINMPLLYGEGNKAFRRLQEKIMKQAFDHTLLAWAILPWHEGYVEAGKEKDDDGFAVLADSPADFLGCGSLVHRRPHTGGYHETSYEMTNRGLQIELPLRRVSSSGVYIAKLPCSDLRRPDALLGMMLRREGDVFIRTSRALILEDDSMTRSMEDYFTHRVALLDNTGQVHSSKSAIIVDIPENYRCEVKYLNPSFQIKNNRLRMPSNSLRISYPQNLHETDETKIWRLILSPFAKLVGIVTRNSGLFSSSTQFQLQLTKHIGQHEVSCLLCLDHTFDEPFKFYLACLPGYTPTQWPIPCREILTNWNNLKSLEVQDAFLNMEVMRDWGFGKNVLIKVEESSEPAPHDTIIFQVAKLYMYGRQRMDELTRDSRLTFSPHIALLIVSLFSLPPLLSLGWGFLLYRQLSWRREHQVLGHLVREKGWRLFEHLIIMMATSSVYLEGTYHMQHATAILIMVLMFPLLAFETILKTYI